MGVVISNPIVPILSNFLFEINGNKLTVTASDLHTTISSEIEINSNDKFDITVPAKILLETLKNLFDQPIQFIVDTKSFSIELISDNGKYKITGESAADFPKTAVLKNTDLVEISTDTFKHAIKNTLFATSTDELRPAMTGVLMEVSKKKITFAATDGHRLIRYDRLDVSNKSNANLIIPRKTLTILNAILPTQNGDLAIDLNETNASFKFGNTVLISRLIEEKFPAYQNVIPETNSADMTISRLDLVSTLKRLSIYANKNTHMVIFNITNNELNVKGEDLDYSNEANETLACEYAGEEFVIGFNAKFLLEVLVNLNAEQVHFKLIGANRAVVIVSTEKSEQEDMLSLVMPIMIPVYA